MGYLGIAVRVTDDAPYLRAVLLDDVAPGEVQVFDFNPTKDELPADQILGIAQGLEGRLAIATSPVERVVLRLGDERQGHGRKPIVTRTRTEGAVMFVVRRVCADVRALHGQDIGRACGTNKEGAEVQAAALIAEAKWRVAASAALAARSL